MQLPATSRQLDGTSKGPLAITADLSRRFSHGLMNRMGFMRSDSGKLWHTGPIGGGYARVNVLPPNYSSPSRRNRKGMHIALVSGPCGYFCDIPSHCAGRGR